MKLVFQWIAITVLVLTYLAALLAVLHPHVSPAYRSYFIDHNSTDWNVVHYAGAPEQGMNFKRDGLPDWVTSTVGLSVRDPMGRWTDRDVARTPGILFARPFQGTVCVDLSVAPAPAMSGKEFGLRMGDKTETLKLTKEGFSEFQIPFTLERGSEKLELFLPDKLPRENEMDHSSTDTRRLGLLISTLRVVSGPCVGNGNVQRN